MIGITSIVDDKDESRREDTRVVRIDAACEVVASAETKMQGASAPDGTRLPVEPMRPFPMDALRDAAGRRAGSVNPYQLSSSDFDIALITPVLTYAAQNPSVPASGAAGNATRKPAVAPEFVRPLMDFGNWSEYVAEFPPVLLVRVTPKLVEGFWTKVGRARRVDAGCRRCRRSSASRQASRGCARSAAMPR